jgi:hypothetical protein
MKRACNLLIYRALEASVKKYADTIGKPIGIIGQATDFSVVVFRLHFMLVSEEHLMKSNKNQWLLNLPSPPNLPCGATNQGIYRSSGFLMVAEGKRESEMDS